MLDWCKIEWPKAGQLPPERQSVHAVAQWFVRELHKRGREYSDDAKSFMVLLLAYGDPTNADHSRFKPDLEPRASRALGLDESNTSRTMRAVIAGAGGVRPYGLFTTTGRTYSRVSTRDLGALCDALAGTDPDAALENLLEHNEGRFDGMALGGMSQIAYVLRPDLYPALNSRTVFRRWQDLVFDDDYSRFVELSQALRAFCDEHGFPVAHRFKYFDRYLEAYHVVDVDHPEEGEARMGLPRGSLLKFYNALGAATAVLSDDQPDADDENRDVNNSSENDAGHAETDQDQDDPGAYEDDYAPTDDDDRTEALRAIKQRLGQPEFRAQLLNLHGHRCQVTGCSQACLLEAAHIRPFRGERDHHPQNGLLLRTDIHTLFDRGLLWIEPRTRLIRIHESIRDEFYRSLAGKALNCSGCQPSEEALAWHLERVVSHAVTD